VGIELTASSFYSEEVAVTFIGSVANSPYFMTKLGQQLLQGNNKRYVIMEPKFPPVIGSVLLAMKQLDIIIDDAIIHNLSEHILAESKGVNSTSAI